jgi:hypothetical protein
MVLVFFVATKEYVIPLLYQKACMYTNFIPHPSEGAPPPPLFSFVKSLYTCEGVQGKSSNNLAREKKKKKNPQNNEML